MRAARTAGTNVAVTATPSATAVTSPIAEPVSGGAPVLPSRPAVGSVSSGAPSHPTASPATAASRATTMYSARSTAAIKLGVPPTALSSPTRRIWSAIRPPTSTATLERASSTSSQPPVSRALRWFRTRVEVASSISCQDCRSGGAASESSVPGGAFSGGLCASTKAGAAAGSASFRYRTYASDSSCGARLRASAWLTQTSPAGMQKARQDTSGYGAAAAVTASPATRNDRRPRVIGSPAPIPNESAKAASTTTPPPSNQRPSVSSGWLIGAGAVSRPSTRACTVWPCTPSLLQSTGYGPL